MSWGDTTPYYPLRSQKWWLEDKHKAVVDAYQASPSTLHRQGHGGRLIFISSPSWSFSVSWRYWCSVKNNPVIEVSQRVFRCQHNVHSMLEHFRGRRHARGQATEVEESVTIQKGCLWESPECRPAIKYSEPSTESRISSILGRG